MKLRNTVLIVGAVGMAAMIQTAQASLDLGTTASLAALSGTPGAYLTIGDKVFSDFTYKATGLTSFDPLNGITVTATQVGANDYELIWGGNMSLVAGPLTSADLLLGYTVEATSGKVFAIDQNYTGQATPAVPGQFLTVSETVTLPASTTIIASSYLDRAITSTSFTAVGAILNPNASIINVTKDIGFGTIPGGFLTISKVVQSFDEISSVPEPTTLLAGALLLLPFGASTLRILRRNRMS